MAVDDLGYLYLDGELASPTLYTHRVYNTTRPIWSSKIIAVEIINFSLWGGFILQTSNGIFSDESWKCTKERQKTT